MNLRAILCLLFVNFSFIFAAPAQQRLRFTDIPDTTVPSRVWIMGGFTAGLTAGSLVALNQYWYKDYDKTSFHFFNDGREWQQMDKIGHAFTAYMTAKYSRELWRWTGIPKKKQIWLGAASSIVYQSVIEVLDGYSSEWGFSWNDIGANLLGTGLMVSQELAWDEQRIHLKFSYLGEKYPGDPVIKNRTDDIFGNGFPERVLKDYNGQTYWLSVNLFAFSAQKNHRLKWLNLALGYGGKNMYGGDDNTWEYDGVHYDYNHVKRLRQFYLSPDIDFTQIPTKKKGLKILFQVMNMIKIPAPTLEYRTDGHWKGHWLF